MPWNRKARDANNVTDWAQWGWAYGTWAYHYRFANAVRENRGIDWWFNAATVPDHHGFFNMSYGTSNCNVYRQTAKKIVFEVRSDYPWAEGGRFNTIHIDDIDYWVEVDCAKYTWPQVNETGDQAQARGGGDRAPHHDHHAGPGRRPARDRLAPLGLRRGHGGRRLQGPRHPHGNAQFRPDQADRIRTGDQRLQEPRQSARASTPSPSPSMRSGTTTRSTGTSNWPSTTPATRTTSRTSPGSTT